MCHALRKGMKLPNVPGEPENVLTFKIHSGKSTRRTWMIPILVTRREVKVFCNYFGTFVSSGNRGKINFYKDISIAPLSSRIPIHSNPSSTVGAMSFLNSVNLFLVHLSTGWVKKKNSRLEGPCSLHIKSILLKTVLLY